MKTIKERILSIIIIVAMLLSGMCFEYIQADSLFVHENTESHMPILTSANDLAPMQMFCTNEMLGEHRLVSREVQLRGNSHKLIHRMGMYIFSWEILPGNPLLKEVTLQSTSEIEPCVGEVIVAYIHHQDGEKNSF